MLATVFVYGTLMPGHLRWGLIAPFAVRHRPGAVPGRLYDTGQGWPAARFDPADAETVPGWLVEVAPASVGTLLPQLDEVEGAVVDDRPVDGDRRVPDLLPGAYRRTRVLATDGTEAWAYDAVAVPDGWVQVPRWAEQPEN